MLFTFSTLRPGGGHSSIHEDGYGTVDSGHVNLHGYNEVVILRRIPDIHKVNASARLGVKAWLSLPHDRREQFRWPSSTDIEWFKSMKYVIKVMPCMREWKDFKSPTFYCPARLTC